jgi:hypothetical protein
MFQHEQTIVVLGHKGETWLDICMNIALEEHTYRV